MTELDPLVEVPTQDVVASVDADQVEADEAGTAEAEAADDSSIALAVDPAVDAAVDAAVDPAVDAIRSIEAILIVADEPVPTEMLAQLIGLGSDRTEQLCTDLAAAYESDGHGFQLVFVAGGWRFRSHPEQAAAVERFVLDGQVSRLSAAALETLAIVAYKQPISRAQIAQIRGVNVDGVMRTLTQRGYVAEVGTDPGPGQATLFGTTAKFLESMGLGTLTQLAPLADFVPGAEIMEALEAGLRVEIAPAADPAHTPPGAGTAETAAESTADTTEAALPYADPGLVGPSA